MRPAGISRSSGPHRAGHRSAGMGGVGHGSCLPRPRGTSARRGTPWRARFGQPNGPTHCVVSAAIRPIQYASFRPPARLGQPRQGLTLQCADSHVRGPYKPSGPDKARRYRKCAWRSDASWRKAGLGWRRRSNRPPCGKMCGSLSRSWFQSTPWIYGLASSSAT